ncbi:MAG: gluconate 2-dehydrogenase subunit 3 family protein [Gemmatimonadaceae bacterium]|nr:gluconate 2-dehydrogenase subunit 3 family protein [Gemmatimonadaceae bacterium]NUQ93348.1 gluconate 2-dehydrogenase subunit 3 family protein [Gemmatimonadaceae bacterium]NUR18691.1 gluconate 2-dehydrogenase subunit 3 family protein [Gemmatimonadaceae bacterium]NUS96440.1 gluconate 2-dehydrogenase subunit 3 family protein [Gemmatimonadaceae bacterium]
MREMNRREALKATTATLGTLLLATSGVLAACDRAPKRATNGVLDAEHQDLAEEMADTLLPTTPASPGAKAAGIGPFMNVLLTDCYPPEQQNLLRDGLRKFGSGAGKDFAKKTRAEREALLREMSAKAKAAAPDPHWFPIFRDVALRSYFTSEVGMTKALRYTLVPGRWNGCVPLQPGQPAWG